MKALRTQIVIEGIRARKDRSLGLTITTPELTSEEKALFMDMQGHAATALIELIDVDFPTEVRTVNKELNQKSQSQRIRAVLYILYTQNPEDQTFEEYYMAKTEKYIEFLKGKIEE